MRKGEKRKIKWYLYVDGKRLTTLFRKRNIGEIVNTQTTDYNAKVYAIDGRCIYAKTIKGWVNMYILKARNTGEILNHNEDISIVLHRSESLSRAFYPNKPSIYSRLNDLQCEIQVAFDVPENKMLKKLELPLSLINLILYQYNMVIEIN